MGRPLSHFEGTKQKARAEKANLKREHICLMHTGVSAQDPRRFAASLLGMIVGDDYGSRFYWELVDKALAEEASMHFSPMDGTGLFYGYLRCGTPNAAKVVSIADGIFRDLVANGITGEELVKAKNKVLSALVLKNELPMGRLVDLGFNWMYLGEYRSIEQDVAGDQGRDGGRRQSSDPRDRPGQLHPILSRPGGRRLTQDFAATGEFGRGRCADQKAIPGGLGAAVSGWQPQAN